MQAKYSRTSQSFHAAKLSASASQSLLSASISWRLRRLLALQQQAKPLQRCLSELSISADDKRWWRDRSQQHQQRRHRLSRGAVAAAFGAAFAVAKDNLPADEFLDCCRSGDADCVRRLLFRCRLLRQHGSASRQAAADAEDPVRLLVNSRHRFGWTALAAAVVNGHAEVARELLSQGADVNAVDNFTGAFSVAAQQRLSSAEVSSIRSSDFNARLNHGATFAGCTALHYAALMDSALLVQLLLDAKADPTLRSSEGHRPSAYAPDGSEARRLLQSAEAAAERRQRRQFPLERRLRESLVGQEAAIRCVAAAIRRKENGWSDAEHPLVFLFLGSSGVGKTELAKQVSLYLSRDSKQQQQQQQQQKQRPAEADSGFVRLDMSEYAEKHEAAKLIGAPPGYVGHESGGQLTKALQRCPSATVLLDEVDKAHPDVLSTLLQLFDEGRLTDGQGRTVNCKDAVFIMTSNLAADQIAEYGQQLRQALSGKSGGGSGELEVEAEVSREFKDRVVRPILKRHFRRDEFLGRINEIVYFLPFNAAELAKLVNRQLNKWARVAKERHGIRLAWDDRAVKVLADGYDYHYGARSLKYEVDRQVVSQLALADEFGLLAQGDVVELVVSEAAGARKIDLKVCRGQAGSSTYSAVLLSDKQAESDAAAAAS